MQLTRRSVHTVTLRQLQKINRQDCLSKCQSGKAPKVCTGGVCGFARCRKLCWLVDSHFAPLTVFLTQGNLFSPSFRCFVLADGAFLQIGTKKGRFQRAYLQKCTMAELGGQASGPRSPHTRYSRMVDSERGLYRQDFCRGIVIDKSGHVVFASWSHFLGMIEEMPIYSNGTKLGHFSLRAPPPVMVSSCVKFSHSA